MRPGSSLPLVRRVHADGVLREFVHPADGSAPVERPVGTAPTEPPALEPAVLGGPVPERGFHRLGQLVGRNTTAADLSRPLALPLLRASCDGGGSCCGLYHHVPATPGDRDRITALLAPGWDRPVALGEVFHPAFDPHPEGPLNVVSIGGSCAFLDGDGLCAVHKAGGPESKPQACVSYPAHLVVCGERWYASLRPECACVARTALEGPQLSDDAIGWARLRQMMLAVWTVPSLVAVDGERVITRTTYRGWTEEQVAGLSTSFDPAETLFAGLHGLDLLAERDLDRSLPSAAAELLDDPWLERARAWLAAESAAAAIAQAPGSPARRAVDWALRCVQALLDGQDRRTRGSRGRAADWSRRAALTTGLLMHGHGLLEEPLLRPAVIQLIRVVEVARASRAIQPAEEVDPRLEELTAWFYLWRTLGRDVW